MTEKASSRRRVTKKASRRALTDTPTGTVTFLFTDIEGSTALWENHPAQMQDALARHDEILRAAVEASPLALDAILLTHFHGDHFGGVPFFILDAQFISRRERPLVLAGPPGLEDRINEAMEVLYPGSPQERREFTLKFVELEDETTTTIGQCTVTPYGVVHPSGAPSYALRIALGSKILAYSGDTEWTDTLIPAARGADLFICECNFLEKNAGYHLDYRTLMDHRTELECHRLVLTHMNEEMLRRIQNLDVEGAEDGKSLVL